MARPEICAETAIFSTAIFLPYGDIKSHYFVPDYMKPAKAKNG